MAGSGDGMTRDIFLSTFLVLAAVADWSVVAAAAGASSFSGATLRIFLLYSPDASIFFPLLI
jgi:hypothetical protein